MAKKEVIKQEIKNEIPKKEVKLYNIVSALAFFGINKRNYTFLSKKYKNDSYTIDVWEQVFIENQISLNQDIIKKIKLATNDNI